MTSFAKYRQNYTFKVRKPSFTVQSISTRLQQTCLEVFYSVDFFNFFLPVAREGDNRGFFSLYRVLFSPSSSVTGEMPNSGGMPSIAALHPAPSDALKSLSDDHISLS